MHEPSMQIKSCILVCYRHAVLLQELCSFQIQMTRGDQKATQKEEVSAETGKPVMSATLLFSLKRCRIRLLLRPVKMLSSEGVVMRLHA